MMTAFYSPDIPTNNVIQSDDTTANTLENNKPFTRFVSTTYPDPMDISGNTYADHARITIDGNIDFLAQKTSETWSGVGNETNPIEITGYNFTSTSGVLISISNTDLHFKIEGNFFFVPTENYNGINLNNVTNGNITNNYFNKVDFGLSFTDVNFTTIQMNHFDAFAGIYINSGNNNSIIGNYFEVQDSAVTLFSSSTFFNEIYNNTFLGVAYGVYMLGSSQNEISYSNFHMTTLYGIYATQFGGFNSSFNIIMDNFIHDAVGFNPTGMLISSYSHNNTIYRNTITNITLSIRLSYSDYNTVHENVISNTTQAISLENSQWNEVYRNNISDVTIDLSSANAIYMYRAGNNIFHDNNITDVDNAIQMYQSSQNSLHGNIMTVVRNFGILMTTSTLNSISDNKIDGGDIGFYLGTSSTNNTMSKNLLQSQNVGILLRTTSHYNTFVENRIENATNYGIDSTTSSYLTIWNNTIINSGLRGIDIDSSYHVVAFNELTNNGQYGVYLDSVFTCEIYNNTIKQHSTAGVYVFSTSQYNASFNVFANNSIGLSLILSHSAPIIGNIFSNNTDTGLYLDTSDGCTITDNLFEHNGIRGMRLLVSTGNTIGNNTVHANSLHGIVIQTGSSLNLIQDNVITNNLGYGVWVAGNQNWVWLNTLSNNDVGIFIDSANINSIESNLIGYNTDGVWLYNADTTTVQLNTIFNNTQYGIYSESGFPETNSDNLIYNNTLVSNGVYGVYLDSTTYTTMVKWNDFVDNTVHGADSNPPAYGNVWDQNFYDDWDQVESSYSIDFDTTDINPATTPINPSMVHYLLPAHILVPEGSVLYTGDITITWTPGYDSDGHAIDYSLYYTNNTGTDWYFIVGILTNYSYYWNATSLSEGGDYQVRIFTTDSASNSVYTTSNTFGIDTNAPRLGVVPSNFTVELSFDPPPELYFSAFDSNPDFAYIEWMGYEMSDPTFWTNDTVEPLMFFDGSVQFGVGEHALYLVVLDTAGHEARYLFYITVEDTVEPTIVIEETDQTFELGPHGNELSWTTYDLAAGTYDVYFNSSRDMNGTWVSYAGTYLNVDDYMPGIYNVTIVFYDTSGNSVTRSINLTIIDTTSPSIIEFPANDTIEFGTPSNYLNWTLSELDPSVFNVTINNEFSEQLPYANGTVLLNIDGLPLGYNNITVVFYDNSGNIANDSVFITVSDTISPIISPQSDVVLEFGSIGNIVNWTASDLLPSNYTVFIDESYWTSGSWDNESEVSISIDDLSIGNHSFQITFGDSSNNQEMAEIGINVRDTVLPEIVSSPEDIEYNFGTTGNILGWIVTDLDSGNYSVYIDDTYVTTGTWTSSLPVEISIDGLSVGSHIVEIRFSDGSGNIVLDTVSVVVIDVTTDSSETTTGLPTNGGFPILGIVGMGASAIILVALGLIFIRKKAV